MYARLLLYINFLFSPVTVPFYLSSIVTTRFLTFVLTNEECVDHVHPLHRPVFVEFYRRFLLFLFYFFPSFYFLVFFCFYTFLVVSSVR